MRKSLWVIGLLPALALAQASGGTKDKPAPDKATTAAPAYGPGRGMGAALDNPEALARIEKRVRHAGGGEQAAAGQVDAALTKLRDGRAQMQKVDEETFQAVPAGLTPEKKAKAALFLARFHER